MDNFEGSEKVLNGFKSGIFSLAPIVGTRRPSDLTSCLKILTTKQMLQRLPMALKQVKAGNSSENLLNKTRQIMYSLF